MAEQKQAAAAPPARQQQQDTETRIVEFVPFGAKEKIQLTVAMVKRLLAVKTKTGKGCSDEDAIRFIMMCQARKLNPWEGDAFLIGYDTNDGPKFSLVTAHQAFLKRAELHPEFDGMESGVMVMRGGEMLDLVGDWHMPNDNVLGGWATVYFKNRKYPMKKRLRRTRFDKGWGVWKEDPAGMIVKCTEADALRSAFPTMLGGMYVAEELHAERPTPEVAHAVFEELPPAGDGAATITHTAAATAEQKEVAKLPEPRKVPEPTATPKPEPTAAPEKKQAAPTLQRRERKPAATTIVEAPSTADREKLKAMLAVNKCTPEDFVAAALEEGWIDPEIGAWDKIPDSRFGEFVKPENFQLVADVLEARQAKAGTPSTPPAGQLL